MRSRPHEHWIELCSAARRRALITLVSLICAACSVYSSELGAGRSAEAGGSSAAGSDALAGLAGAEDETPSAGKGEPPSGGGRAGAGPAAGASGGTPGGGTEASTGGTTTGGSAGASAVAGAGGTAGTAPTGNGGNTAGMAGTAGTAADSADLIDGFEDEDITLEQTGGRGGVWYLFDDGTVGKAGPSPLTCSALTGAPAALGSYAMHITATGFTGWGSGLGADFRAGKKPYDASKHTGLRFWARVGTGKNTRHRIQIADATTEAAGGKCNPAPSAPDGEKCGDHFGVNEIFTEEWAQYQVLFADLAQIGWGYSAPALQASAIYDIQITAKAKLDVDLWLDQIEFF